MQTIFQAQCVRWVGWYYVYIFAGICINDHLFEPLPVRLILMLPVDGMLPAILSAILSCTFVSIASMYVQSLSKMQWNSRSGAN